MASFELSELAKRDLQDIHQYGIRQWGEAQADRYYNALYDHLELIADDPMRYPLAENTMYGFRRSVFASHAIYFSASGDRVEILSIIRSQDTKRLQM